MVKITKNAAEKFKEILHEKENAEKLMLRVSFGGFGWGGPKLQLTLDELRNNDDKVVESEGITIIYSTNIEEYLNGAVIDYSNSWFNKGFSIRGGGTSSC